MRVLKWISIIVGGLLVLLILGVLVVVWVVDPNRFKPRIEAAVRDATGRDFTLTGDIELGFFPWLALRAGEGRFGNAPGFGPEPMVSWKSAQLGAKLFPLLRGELLADRVVLKGAEVRLERHADGHANWEGIGGNKPRDPHAKPMELRVDGIEVDDSRIIFVDESAPRQVEVASFHLTTGDIAPGVPYTDTDVSGVLHLDGFKPEGLPFEVRVPTLALPKDFASIEVPAFTLKLGALQANGQVTGAIGEKPKLSGKVSTNEFDAKALATTVGMESLKTTDPNALTRVSLGGEWTFDAGTIGIDALAIALDDTRLRGSFHRAAGEESVGDFDLHGDALDIGRYIPPTDPKSPPFVLPTAALRALKFRGALALDSAKFGDVRMKGVTLRLLLDDAGLRTVKQEAPRP